MKKRLINFFMLMTFISIITIGINNKSYASILSNAQITYQETYTYTGSEIKPIIKVKHNGQELKRDTDYTISYNNNKNVGTASFKLNGLKKGYGYVIKTFKIVQKDISKCKVDTIPSAVYSGEEIKPTIKIEGLKQNKDYSVTYSNNINAGKGNIKIKGKGNYKGIVSKEFQINPVNVKHAKIETSFESRFLKYTGKELKPKFTLMLHGKTLKNKKDYTFKYSDNINAGYGKIVITGTGNYTGQIIKKFKIAKFDMQYGSKFVIKSAKKKGKKVTVVFDVYDSENRKLKKGVDYEIKTCTAESYDQHGYNLKVVVCGKGNYEGTVKESSYHLL